MENENTLQSTDFTTEAPKSGGTPQPGLSQKKYIGKREFIMYAVAAGGQGMIYAVMSSYISDFYVNIMRLPLVGCPAMSPEAT